MGAGAYPGLRELRGARCSGARRPTRHLHEQHPPGRNATGRAGELRRARRSLARAARHATAAIDPPDASSPVYRTPRAFGRVATVLGSQFLAHPPIAPYTVEITAPDHPLVAGIEPFETRDELYVSELHPPLEVLLHTRFTGESRGFAEGSTSPTTNPGPCSTCGDLAQAPSAISPLVIAAAASTCRTSAGRISAGATSAAGRCPEFRDASLGPLPARGRSTGGSGCEV